MNLPCRLSPYGPSPGPALNILTAAVYGKPGLKQEKPAVRAGFSQIGGSSPSQPYYALHRPAIRQAREAAAAASSMHQTAGSDPSPVGTGEDCATEPLRTAGCFSLLVFIGSIRVLHGICRAVLRHFVIRTGLGSTVILPGLRGTVIKIRFRICKTCLGSTLIRRDGLRQKVQRAYKAQTGETHPAGRSGRKQFFPF